MYGKNPTFYCIPRSTAVVYGKNPTFYCTPGTPKNIFFEVFVLVFFCFFFGFFPNTWGKGVMWDRRDGGRGNGLRDGRDEG